MKKIKLLFAAMAAMVGLSANAQLTDGTVYWLQDVSTGQFLSAGASWGTQATIKDVGGLGFETTYVADGVYTLKNVMLNKVHSLSKGLGSNLYVDNGSPAEWTLTASGDGYTMKNGDNYLCNNQSANALYVKPLGTTTDEAQATVWKFLTRDQYDAAIQTYKNGLAASIATSAGLSAATVTALETIITDPNQFISKDYTSSITNASLASNWNGWTHAGTPGSNRGEGAGVGNGCAEFWNGCGYAKQTVSGLPQGIYKIEFAGTYRPGNSNPAKNVPSEETSSPAFGYANNAKVELVHWIDVSAYSNGRSTFFRSDYNNTIYTYVDSDGQLELGIVQDYWNNDNNYAWCPFGQFKLTYYTDQVADEDITALIATIPAEGTVPTSVYSNLTTLKNTLESSKTIAAFNALSAAITDANTLVSSYTAFLFTKDDAEIVGVAAATINEQTTAANAATTSAEIEAATTALHTAVVAAAAGLDYFDITTFTISNASPYANGTNWIATNGTRLNEWASNPVTYDSDNKCAEMWNNTSASMLYTINNLPAGRYRLTAIAGTRDNSGSVLKVGDKTVGLVSVGSLNSRAEVGEWFNNGNGVNELFFNLDATATELTIGLVAGTSGDAWTLWRSFKLETLDESIAAGYLAPGYATLVEEATATFNNTAYANVTGDEKTALGAAIAATPSTIAEYEAAVDALNNAVAAFTAAKTNYDLYVAEKVNAERISSTITSSITEPTTAAEAVTAFQAILVGEYNYVKDNFNSNAAVKYGMTIDQWTGTATSNGTADTPQTNSNEKWGDAATTYYEQGKNGWSASAWTMNYSITKTLPAGSYVLKIAARASSGTTATLKATVDGIDYYEDLPNFGSTGKGITTTGVASFDDGDTFARNDNTGYGWQWRYLFFYVATEGEVTLQIDASADSEHQWCSFGDVALISNVNLTALTNAYLNFKMDKTLGFQKDEYAPYANADLLQAYADAYDILYEVTEAEDQAQVDGLAATLNAAAWVQNADDVDAIYNGNFAVANGTNPKGWTRSNDGWGQQITDLTAEANDVNDGTTTAWYYNTTGAWEYGKDGVYTMPLAANQTYVLSFKYRSHANGSNNSMTASVLNDYDEGLAEVTFSANGDATKFVTAKAYFTTGAAGNYILSLAQSGNTHLTDVSLVKTASATLALNEGSDYTPTDRVYYEEVNLTRTIKAGYNTVCLPFDMTAEQVSDVFGTSAVVYEYEDVASGTSSTINFTPKTGNTIDANVPVLVGSATASVAPHEFTINGVVLKSGEAKVAGTNFDFVGVYDAMTIPSGDCFIGNGALYKSEGSTTIKPFRAYIHDKSGSGVKPILFIDDIETSIEEINGIEAENGVIYNLAGQRISKVQKGINIINGRKVLY